VKEWLKSVLNYRCYPKNKAGYPFLDHPLELPGGWLFSLTDARPGSSRPSDIWSEFEPGWNRVQTRNWQIASLKADNLAVSAQDTNGSVIKNRLWRVTACLIGLYERPDVRESVAVTLHAFGLVNSLTLYQLCCCHRTCAPTFKFVPAPLIVWYIAKFHLVRVVTSRHNELHWLDTSNVSCRVKTWCDDPSGI